MKMKLNNLSQKDFKVLAVPIVGVTVVVLLIIFLVNYIYTNYKSQSTQIRELEARKNALEAKVNELEQNSTAVAKFVNSAVLAVPEDNPSLLIYNQVQRASLASDLNLLDLRSSGSAPEEGDVSSYTANFKTTANANLGNALEFMDEMSRTAPLVKFTGLSLDFEGKEDSELQIDFAGYYALLPATITEIDEPLDKLTDEDIRALNTVSGLLRPAFTSSSPTNTTARPNPFNFNQE